MQAKKQNSYGLEEAVTTDATMVIGVPLESIPLGAKLDYPIYVRIQDRFVFFRKSGDVLTHKRVTSLLNNMADTVFVPKTNWVHFLLTLEEHNSSPINTRNLCFAYLKDVDEKKELFHHELSRYQLASDQLARIIDEDILLGRSLLRRFNDVSVYFSNHSVNTALYCLVIGKILNLSLDQLKHLSFAALFHNVGNLHISEDVLHKPTLLTEKERRLMFLHTIKGASILEKLSLPKEIVQTAMQHHEYIDGSGFPNHLVGKEIHLYAKICSIARFYDRLQSKTSYQEPMSYEQAKKEVLSRKTKFDNELLKILKEFDF